MRKKIAVISCTILLVFLAFWAFYNGLIVKNYTIETDKLGVTESVRIVLITDLHSHIYGENQEKIVSLIKREKPDVIALGGDIADDEVPLEGTKQFLEGIKGLAPVYYVTGNHEFWSYDISNIKATIRNYGVSILESNYEQIKIGKSQFFICGVDDPDIVYYFKPVVDWQGEMLKGFSPLKDKPGFKILLAHRPELIGEYRKYDFDLVLSGHAHGGQLRIPFLLNGLWAPNQGWFPKYAGGEYKHGSLTHIVSRGVFFNPRLPRVFNPPEIVVVEVKGKEISR